MHPLKQWRIDHNVRQTELAGMLGVRPTTVWRWENGQRFVEVEMWEKIRRLTGITPIQLRPDIARFFVEGPASGA